MECKVHDTPTVVVVVVVPCVWGKGRSGGDGGMIEKFLNGTSISYIMKSFLGSPPPPARSRAVHVCTYDCRSLAPCFCASFLDSWQAW